MFLYFPIIPLWRAQLIREVPKPTIFSFHIIEIQPLELKEVLTTYLWGWITPLLWLGPAILCIREITDAIGLPPAKFKGLANEGGFGVYESIVVAAIGYIIVFA